MSKHEVCVGRIGKAHGVRGEVSVEVRTDSPDVRFAPGAVVHPRSKNLAKHPGLPDSLTVDTTRWHQERLLVKFLELADRTAAETARTALLYVELGEKDLPEDPDEFYDHQLIGLRARTTSGEEVGTVTDVLHHTGQDLLVLDADGREVLVPFVQALVPVVDLAEGSLQIADRPGLLAADPAATERDST